MDNLARYSQDLAQQRAFADQEFSKLVEAQNEKEEKQESRKADLEAGLAPLGAAGILGPGGRLVGAALRKVGLTDSADIAQDLIENPTKGVSKLYQKGSQALSDKINSSTTELKDRVDKMGVDRSGVDIGGEEGTELQDLSSLKNIKPEAPDDIGLEPSIKPPTQPEPPNSATPAEPRGASEKEVDDTLNENPDDGFIDLESLRTELEGTENPFSFSSMRASENPLSVPKATRTSSLRTSRFDPDRGKLLEEPQMLQADDSAFPEGSALSQLVDDMATGKVDLVDGIIKSQNLGLDEGQDLSEFQDPFKGISGSSNVSPKISDLQSNLGLKPAQVPNQMSDGEIQGLSSKAEQLTEDKPEPPKPPSPTPQNEVKTGDDENLAGAQDSQAAADNLGHNVQTGATQNLVNAEADQQSKNLSEKAAEEAETNDIEDKSLQSTFKTGVEDAIADNTADLENPVGDIIEVGLGAALLFGSIFGTKVDHTTPNAPVVNPTIGFGIRQD